MFWTQISQLEHKPFLQTFLELKGQTQPLHITQTWMTYISSLLNICLVYLYIRHTPTFKYLLFVPTGK